jgi:hypothetical protein
VCSTVIPTVIWHLWSVKGWGASPHLALPKVMPTDVSGSVDMEKVEPGPNPSPYWIAMVAGVARMLFPTVFARIEAGIGQRAGAIIAAAVVLLFLGATLIAFWL